MRHQFKAVREDAHVASGTRLFQHISRYSLHEFRFAWLDGLWVSRMIKVTARPGLVERKEIWALSFEWLRENATTVHIELRSWGLEDQLSWLAKYCSLWSLQTLLSILLAPMRELWSRWVELTLWWRATVQHAVAAIQCFGTVHPYRFSVERWFWWKERKVNLSSNMSILQPDIQ